MAMISASEATETVVSGPPRSNWDYVHQLAHQIQGLGLRRLESLAETMFSRPVADLSRLDASCLIDCLKNIQTREIDIDNMLSQTTDKH